MLSYGATANILPLSVNGSQWIYPELPVLTAARNGDYATAVLLLEQDPDLNLTDLDGNTILHLACYSHCVELVSFLFKQKIVSSKISASNNKGNTPLHILMSGEDAITYKEEVCEILEILLGNGANINSTNVANKTPLYLAARSNLPSVVQRLLEAGADPTIISREGRSVLHAACHAGSHESLSLLLKNKKTANLVLVEDQNGFAPFHVAVSSCSLNCCEILLKNGDHLTRNDSQDRSRCSLVLNNMPSAQLLLKRIFDSSIEVSERDQESADFFIKMNFSPVLSQSSEEAESSLISDISCSKYELLIKHPLIESFLYLKWQRISWLFYINVFVYFLFLLVHTYYILKTYGKFNSWGNNLSLRKLILVSHPVLFFFIIITGCTTIIANISQYLKQWETYFKITALSTAAYVVFAKNNLYSNTDTETLVAAVSIFFTWLEFLMLLGRFPALGVYILMFTRVAKSIITFLFAFSSLLIAFALSFEVLLNNIDVFETFPISFVKTLMMMVGEIDYTAIYEHLQKSKSSRAKLIIIQIFLAAFLFIVPVLMTNLLIGIAVNDLPDLKYHGKIRRLLKEASYLESYERIPLVFKRFTCIPRSLIDIFSNRSIIRRHITIYPNKHKKYKMTSTRVPSDSIKAAIALGEKRRSELEDLDTSFKKFVKEYRNDRQNLEGALEVLHETIMSEKVTKQTSSFEITSSRFKSRRRLKTMLRQKQSESILDNSDQFSN